MFEKNPNKCRHPGCNCEVPKGTKYCSDYCESIGNQPSFACGAGMSSARLERRRRAPPLIELRRS